MHVNMEGENVHVTEAVPFYDGAVNVGFKNIFLKLFVGSAIIGTVVAIPLAFLPMPVAKKTSSSIHVKDRWWDVNER